MISGATQYIWTGVFAYLQICNTITSCPVSSNTVSTRDVFIQGKLDLYENYWDLTQNPAYDGTSVKSKFILQFSLDIKMK